MSVSRVMAWTVILCVTFCLSVCSRTPGKFMPSYTPTVAESTNNFAFDLHKTFPKVGNLVFSPWSIAFSLGMIMLGAGGETLKEMKKVMFLSQMETESVHYGFKQLREHLLRYNQQYEMNMFATILVEEDHNVSPVYKLKLQRYYDAHIHEASFSKLGELVTEWVNSWTSLKTGGKIRNIMSTVPDPDTIMLLLTANYFKGLWVEPFDENRTTLAAFTNSNGQKSNVDTMFAVRNMTIYTDYDLAVEAVDIPMKGDISFLLVMPESPRDFENLERNISTKFFELLYQGMTEKPVELSVPKFQVTSREELQHSLEKLGMKSLFSYTDGDLSGISSNRGLAVQRVIHKAALEIDEEGAVASSATVISIVSRIKVYKLHFNSPFIFFIRDVRSGVILFMGRISDL